MDTYNPTIFFQDMAFTYSGSARPSLRRITAKVPRGACIVLTGASGCGKTTFTRCVNNLVPEFYEGALEGRAEVLGEDIRHKSAGQAGRQVASVFQDPRTQFFTTESAAEVAFACENYGMPVDEMHRRVQAAFARMGIEHLKDRSVFSLSSGERQKVAIASAWAFGAEVFVLDEPSANLDAGSIAHLRDILVSLKAEGHTLLISEHRLYYLKDVADAIWVMEDGELRQRIAPGAFAAFSPDAWRAMGLRQLDLRRITLQHSARPPPVPGGPADAAVEMQVAHLSYRHRGQRHLLRDVSFSATGGEVVAILGENGCGKTTLGKLLAGLIRGCGKAVSIDGKVCGRRALGRQCYFVMQEADHQLYTDSVERELLLGHGKNDASVREKARVGLAILGLAPFADAHPCALSGGQKQRLTVLCAALSGRPIVFLDEPTSGLDYANMAALAKVVHGMRADGRLVFVISHDIEFLSLVCGRAILLQGGTVAADFPVRTRADFARVQNALLPKGEEVGTDVRDNRACG